jgi:hypothetical protein
MDPPIDILQLAASGEADLVYSVFTADLLAQVLSDCGAQVPEGLALDRAYLIGRIGASLEYLTFFLTNYQLNGERRMVPNPVVAAPQAPALHFTPEQIAQLKEVMRQVANGSIPVLGADGPPPADLPPMPADMLEIDGKKLLSPVFEVEDDVSHNTINKLNLFFFHHSIHHCHLLHSYHHTPHQTNTPH